MLLLFPKSKKEELREQRARDIETEMLFNTKKRSFICAGLENE
jgi:hypothetical protein